MGKTSLAINAAGFYHARDKRVLLVDADPQGTTTKWAEISSTMPFPVVRLARENMSGELVELGSNYERVVVDGPPRAEALSRAVVIASDLIVLPIEPSGASDWASRVTIQQVQEARRFHSELKAAFLVSRALSRTVIANVIREHVADVGIPVLAATVFSRVAFAEALTMGKTIYEWAPRSAAAGDITQAMHEIEALADDEKPTQT